jgi:hypothetical protein
VWKSLFGYEQKKIIKISTSAEGGLSKDAIDCGKEPEMRYNGVELDLYTKKNILKGGNNDREI